MAQPAGDSGLWPPGPLAGIPSFAWASYFLPRDTRAAVSSVPAGTYCFFPIEPSGRALGGDCELVAPLVSRHLMWTCMNMPFPPPGVRERERESERAVSEHRVGLWVKSNYSSHTCLGRECVCLGVTGVTAVLWPQDRASFASLSLPVGSADGTTEGCPCCGHCSCQGRRASVLG